MGDSSSKNLRTFRGLCLSFYFLQTRTNIPNTYSFPPTCLSPLRVEIHSTPLCNCSLLVARWSSGGLWDQVNILPLNCTFHLLSLCTLFLVLGHLLDFDTSFPGSGVWRIPLILCFLCPCILFVHSSSLSYCVALLSSCSCKHSKCLSIPYGFVSPLLVKAFLDA